jgi:transposase-like protein
MDCVKCESSNYRKDGIVGGKQRYLCKLCGHRYTVSLRSGTGCAAVKRLALQLYLEGFGFRSIARSLGFSNVTILNWIRAFGEQLPPLKNDKPVEIMELDEMHSYVGSKKTIAGDGLLLIEMGDDFSVAKWVPAIRKQEKNSGNL